MNDGSNDWIVEDKSLGTKVTENENRSPSQTKNKNQIKLVKHYCGGIEHSSWLEWRWWVSSIGLQPCQTFLDFNPSNTAQQGVWGSWALRRCACKYDVRSIWGECRWLPWGWPGAGRGWAVRSGQRAQTCNGNRELWMEARFIGSQ